jgi:glycosyltransferase involved in cell wall biosynthesis
LRLRKPRRIKYFGDTPAYSDFFAESVDDAEDVDRFKRQYGIEGPYWFFVGRRNPYKNFNALLRAWKLFRDRTGIDSWLVVTGAYGDLERFEIAYLMQHGLEQRVVMTRSVDDRRLRTIYRGAAAFVFPSLYEGFGIPVLEAFACGTPCILADTRVFREVAQDAALYFEPYSDESFAGQLERALGGDTRAELVAKGRERLGAYSWDASARQLSDLYRSLA